MKTFLSILSFAGLGFFGCQGSAGDPKTLGLADLNPPGTVSTVTQDGGVELRWNSGNAEADFVGYHVFATTMAAEDLDALAAYPDYVKISEAGVPRCADNTKFFEAFGLAASTKSCSGAKDSAATASLTGSSSSASLLADDTTTGTSTSTDEVMSNFVPCLDPKDGTTNLGTTSISYKVSTMPAIGLSRCLVKKAYDPTTKALVDMKNGTTYAFIVVSVMGSKYNKISWSSNRVTDTPSKTAYDASFTLNPGKRRKFVIDTTTFDAVTLDSAESGCSDTSTAECSIAGTNTEATDAIYIGRQSGKQRIFISTPTTGSIKIIGRGPQTYDPANADTPQPRIPGDAAVKDTTTYSTLGSVLTVYDNKVFDFVVTTGTGTYHYGKLVFGDLALATATDETSEMTVNVRVIMQPTAGVNDYFR